MIGVQGTFYFGEKGTKTFGVDTGPTKFKPSRKEGFSFGLYGSLRNLHFD